MSRHDQVPVLTGLRGVAAYSVLVAHAVDFAFLGRLHAYVVGLVHFGMSLFFVLSGFVIYYNYATALGEGRIKGSYRFFVARFARLYPLYIVMFAISFAIQPHKFLLGYPLIGLSGLTLTQSWFNVQGVTGSPFGQSWSISTEWFFYAAFLFICVPITRIRKPERALGYFLVVVFMALAFLFAHRDQITALITPYVPHTLPVSAPPWLWLTYFSPYLRILEFVAGLLACRIYLDRKDRPFDDKAAMLVTGACLIWTVTVIAGAGTLADGPWLDMVQSFAYAPAIAPLLAILCIGTSALSRAISGRVLLILGEISYSVYVLQFVINLELSRSGYWAISNDQTTNRIAFCLMAIVITTIAAVFSYWLLERPSRYLIRTVMMKPIKRA